MTTPSTLDSDPRGPSTLTRPSGVRRSIARHMVASRATSPHAAMGMEVRFDRVLAAPGAGVVAYVGWACAQALREFPFVNASWEAGGIRVFEQVHLGVAVDLGYEGLVVPVVRQAHELDPAGLHERIADLTARAHARRLGAAELGGGTFTLSSLGRSGTLFTIPILNQPQSAILSCDTITRRPVVLDDGTIGVGAVGVLTVAFDHRTFDGAYCAAFLGRVRDLLQSL